MSSRLLHVVTVPATLSLMRGQLGYCAQEGFDVHLAASFDGKLPTPEPGVTFHSMPLTRQWAPAKDASAVVTAPARMAALTVDLVDMFLFSRWVAPHTVPQARIGQFGPGLPVLHLFGDTIS